MVVKGTLDWFADEMLCTQAIGPQFVLSYKYLLNHFVSIFKLEGDRSKTGYGIIKKQ